MKRLLILLAIMLVIGFFSLLIVAAHDEGMIKNIFLVKICSVVVKFFYFPLWYVEHKIMPSSNTFFVVMYFVNIILWTLVIYFSIYFIRKIYNTIGL